MNAPYNTSHSNVIMSNLNGHQDLDIIVGNYGCNFAVPNDLLITYLLPCISKKLSSPKSLPSEKRSESYNSKWRYRQSETGYVNSKSKWKVPRMEATVTKFPDRWDQGTWIAFLAAKMQAKKILKNTHAVCHTIIFAPCIKLVFTEII